ncbi:MAG: DUF4340 domain-containing protein [Bacteroidota bacterium]
MNKNTLVLLGILFVLAVTAFFLFQRPGETSLTETGRDLLLELDSASVNGITIASPTSSITLVRKESVWFIEHPIQAPADQPFVGTLFREAGKLSINSVISSKAEKHSLFQVDSAGTKVTFTYESGESVSIVLGKSGPSFTDVYARREGSNDVVLVSAGISYTANRPVKEWRDHTILSLPTESIREVGFRYGDTTFTLAWKDSSWMIGISPVQESAARGLISSLSNLRADDFFDASPSKGSKRIGDVSVSGIQIRWHQSPESDRYFVQTSSSPQWYQVDAWKAQQVLKRKKDLIAAK